MNRIEMGTISEGYDAFLVTKGFEYGYEVVEEDVSNTYDNLTDFADAVMIINLGMGYYRLKLIAKALLKKLAEEGRDETFRFCIDKLQMDSEELSILGGDEL